MEKNTILSISTCHRYLVSAEHEDNNEYKPTRKWVLSPMQQRTTYLPFFFFMESYNSAKYYQAT